MATQLRSPWYDPYGQTPAFGGQAFAQPASTDLSAPSDINSNAVGGSQPGSFTPPADRGPGSRPPSQQMGSTPGANNVSGASVGNNWWDKTAGNEYGPTTMIANPAAFWQSYAMHQLGLGLNSNTGNWLSQLVQDPVGVARATGALGPGLASNDAELAAMSQLGGLLGRNASFDPSTLIRNTLQQLVNFNPNQKGGGQGGNALALQLYSDNPVTMAGNVMTFLKGVLGGIIPQDTFNQIGTAMTLAANTISGKAVNTPGTTLISDRPGQGVAQQFMQILHQFGVI